MQKNSAERLAPIAKSVQAWEGHVTRADLQRQDVIDKPEQQGHGNEENHRGTVHGEKLVERVGRNQVIVRHGQLQTDDKCFESADDEKEETGQHVENTDALVIDR